MLAKETSGWVHLPLQFDCNNVENCVKHHRIHTIKDLPLCKNQWKDFLTGCPKRLKLDDRCIFQRRLIKEPQSVKKGLNSLPKTILFDWTKIKAFADDRLNVTKIVIYVLDMGRKHHGKRRKCWLPAFSPFPTMFKGFFLRVIKIQDCVVKGKLFQY